MSSSQRRRSTQPEPLRDTSIPELAILGYEGGTHLGGVLVLEAKRVGINTEFIPAQGLGNKYDPLRWVLWKWDKRPVNLRRNSMKVVDRVLASQAQNFLVTGSAPIDADGVRRLNRSGVRTAIYLTDDPWNSAHRAGWFLEALPEYAAVFSTKTAIIQDLRNLGCQNIRFLPFGYSPSVSYPEKPLSPEEGAQFESDVMFYGGADEDRLNLIKVIIKNKWKLHLYGGYWQKDRFTRPYWRGMADQRTLRLAISGAKINLCLVRRANRDGHSMRTFEIPAVGGCMLTEDTDEHRRLLGDEGVNTIYFRNKSEMQEKIKVLLSRPQQRSLLAQALHQIVTTGGHSYADRLQSILGR